MQLHRFYPEDKNALVRQLIQNLIVFSPVIFAKKMLSLPPIGLTALAYVLVCWLSFLIIVTSSYIRHKSQGLDHYLDTVVSRPAAYLWGAATVSILAAFGINPKFGALSLLYVIIGLLHDLVLVRVVLLDVIFLAVEFCVKTVLGAAIMQVWISPWLMLCTFMAALIVSLGKRRNEITTSSGPYAREVLGQYSPRLIDQMLAVVTSSAFIAYALYTISDHVIEEFGTTHLIYTQPMVLYGILRYLYLVHNTSLDEGSELAILRDPPMILDAILWVLTVIGVIYVFH